MEVEDPALVNASRGERQSPLHAPVSRALPRVAWWFISGAALAVGIWYFYRGFFRSGFAVTQGDNGDGRLTEVIAGHWRDPFQFAGGFTDTGIFYPFGQGLMYSDTLMAYGILTIPLVAGGIDPSIAFQWALIFASAVGYASTVALLRLGPRAPWPLAIAAAFIAIFANGLLVASNHPQLLALQLIPAVGLSYLLGLRASRFTSRVLLGAISGALFGLIAYSAFYIGWFAVVGGLLALIFWIFIGRGNFPLGRLLGHRGQLIWSFFGGSLPFVLVFAYTYGPLLQSGAGRSIEEIRFFALSPADLLGVSPTNALWFHPLYALFDGMSDTERAMAPTPLLLLTAFIMLGLGLSSSRRREPWLAVGISTLLSGFLLWLSPVKWGNPFPWEYISVIPGANAIRAIGRVELMASLLLVTGGATVATRLLQSRRPSKLLAVAGSGLLCVLVIEQANYLVQQQVEVASVRALRNMGGPIEDCTSFVLLPPFPEQRAEDGQIDAAIIAQSTGIPTWNGASGGVPSGWNLWMSTTEDNYKATLRQYASTQDIARYCTLAVNEGAWRPAKREQ